MSRDELIGKREEYLDVYKMLDALGKLYLKDYMDLDDMNQWLLNVIKFYEKNGVTLTADDFLFEEDDDTSVDDNNEIVSKYMKLFFDNMSKSDSLNSDAFIQFVFGMSDVDDIENPVLGYISFAINRLNNKHSEVFDKYFSIIRHRLLQLDSTFGDVTSDNLLSVRQRVMEKIHEYDDKIVESETLENEEKSWNDMIVKICNLITNNKYSNIDEEGQKYIESRLYDVCVMIIKLKIFENLRSNYEQYSTNHNYKGLVDKIKSNRIKIDSQFEKRDSNINIPIIGKKLAQRCDAKITALSSEIDELTTKYLREFCDSYEMPEWLEECGISDIYDDTKLFGSFDIEELPPSVDKVNADVDYMDSGIIIPNEKSKEFMELCVLAYKYLVGYKKSSYVRRRENNV